MPVAGCCAPKIDKKTEKKCVISHSAAAAFSQSRPLPSHRAQADAVADFYRGRSITVIVGYSAGGGYDLYARALARHMGKHIPGNPTFVAQNMPGAGSLNAANYLYNVAPKDGTVVRHLRARPRDGAADRHRQGAIRRHQVHLARQRHRTR